VTNFRLLLLDANVVIYLFELGIWEAVMNRCEIHLARSIVEEEAIFWEDGQGQRINIDWSRYDGSGGVYVFDVSVSELKAFYDSFDQIYLEKLDLGESESLAYLVNNEDEEYLISSADKIIYRVLGNLGLGEQGISLEEILDKLGMTRRLSHEYSKKYREKWTKKGFEEQLHGFGKK
jgi:hypothetical protein